MKPNPENLQNARYFFETFLHQDWSIDGDTLAEVFESNMGFGKLKEGLKNDAQMLIDSNFNNAELEQILVGRWSIGYEPEYGGFENWREVLQEIIRLCDKYMNMEK